VTPLILFFFGDTWSPVQVGTMVWTPVPLASAGGGIGEFIIGVTAIGGGGATWASVPASGAAWARVSP